MATAIHQLKYKNMARFIKLHKEILREKLEIVDTYVNVDNITLIRKQSGNTKFTLVQLTNGFVEVVESPEEIMSIINGHRHF